MSRGTLAPALLLSVSPTGLSPSLAGLSRTVPLQSEIINAVRTPECTHSGLGSFHFARRYFENRVFFLFLRLLRCFSSPGSLRTPMDSVHGDWGLLSQVSPFRNLRVKWIFAPNRSLSQLITSFVGTWCQGIHPALLLAWPNRIIWVSFLLSLENSRLPSTIKKTLIFLLALVSDIL